LLIKHQFLLKHLHCQEFLCEINKKKFGRISQRKKSEKRRCEDGEAERKNQNKMTRAEGAAG